MPPSAALPVLRALRADDDADGAPSDAFAACARDCILLGGCSSSRAAVACALVAAHRGIDAVPLDWILKVHDVEAFLEDALAVFEAPALPFKVPKK